MTQQFLKVNSAYAEINRRRKINKHYTGHVAISSGKNKQLVYHCSDGRISVALYDNNKQRYDKITSVVLDKLPPNNSELAVAALYLLK